MITYRLLIVDDHSLARRAIRSVLAEEPTFEIVGEAASGAEALEMVRTCVPDIVLMDIHMPGMSGLETTRTMKQLYPHLRIVILTVSDDVADLFAALQFGAQGYLIKNMETDDWISYLKSLFDDSADESRRLADRLFHRFRSNLSPEEPPVSVLTPRERDILICLSDGDHNRQIAERLNISENTVKNHIKNILEKLSMENRVQIASYAVRHGLSRFDQKSQ